MGSKSRPQACLLPSPSSVITVGARETCFVVATFKAEGRILARWGKHRWRIEAFFKTAKERFGLARFGQLDAAWGAAVSHALLVGLCARAVALIFLSPYYTT